jgi:DNA-binding IclR family transcriptional regulator
MDTAVKTLDRLVEVLDCFTREQPAWSLAELSTRLNAPKSTLHRFLTGLEAHGILRRDSYDKKWRLGYHSVIWGSVAAESTTLRDLAKPVVCELVETSGETAILTVYHDREVLCIDLCETPHPVRLRMAIGTRRPAHAGASSKVLMAYLPDDEIQAIVRERGLPKLCTNTITDLETLQVELARIRQQGYAESVEETDHGAWGVATPIRDWRGQVVAGIGVAGPTMRYSKEKVTQYVTLCRQAAERISALMRAGAK